MTENAEAIWPDDILATYQAKETLALITEAMAGADGERRDRAEKLQAAAQAVNDNEQEQLGLKARIEELGRVMVPLQARAKDLFDRMEGTRRMKSRAILERFEQAQEAGRSASIDLSEFLEPGSAELERQLVLGARSAA